MSRYTPELDMKGVDALWDQVRGGMPEPSQPTGDVVPDPRLVEALITTGTHSYVIPRSEAHNRKSPWELLGALARDGNRFFPPTDLCPEQSRTARSLGYWQTWAKYVLWQGQQRAIGLHKAGGYEMTPEFAAAVEAFLREGGPVQNIYLNTTLGPLEDERMWCDVDTSLAGGLSEEATAQAFQRFVDLVRTHLRRGVEAVLSDAEINRQIQATVRRLQKVDLEVCLQDNIARVEYIRTQVETPEERKRFLHLFVQFLAVLGCDPAQVTVELLSGQDALLHGAQALYKPAPQGKAKPVIAIPMSVYGTDKVLSIEALMRLAAHEAAHHQMELVGQTNQPVHGLTHDVLEAACLARLRRCTVTTYGGKRDWPLVQAPRDILNRSGQVKPVMNTVLGAERLPDLTYFDRSQGRFV